MIYLRKDRTKCATRERLGAWQDGELSAAERVVLAAHLERCAACAAALQRLTEGDRRLTDARPMPPPLSPAASRALLQRALAEAGGRRRWAGGWLPWTWGLAAGLALVAAGVGLAGWGVLQRGQEPGGVRVVMVPQAGPRPLAPSPKSWGRGDVRGKPSASVPSPPAFGGGGQGAGARHRRRRRSHRHLTARLASSGVPLPGWRAASAECPAPGTGEQVAERPPGWKPRSVRTKPAIGDWADGPGAGMDEVVQTNTQEIGALPRSVDDQSGMAAAPPPQTFPPPRLLVLVSSEPAPSPVRVTEAPESAPSYARAMALRPDVNGLLTWTQATASNDGTGQKLALVMLSKYPWEWEENE